MANLDRRVDALRRFNRFYTNRLGILDESYLESGFSLAEVRVLWELAHREGPTAAEIGRDLGLDPGYLSRLLRGFEARALIRRTPSAADGRQSHLGLTDAGRTAFAPLDAASRRAIEGWLAPLDETGQQRLVEAATTIERLLGDRGAEPWMLRPHRPGDMGWVVHRHGALYAREYGFDERFEALVAGIVAAFVNDLDPGRERCWIAEQDDHIVGSVFLVRGDEVTARLRLLYVEPEARGQGIGRRLVEECVRFARDRGYRAVTLWTNDVLVAARRIYEAAGFRLVREAPHHSFGRDLVGQDWTREL
jgi:DNA-binding MarR family transcriptional regulator/N-acetylglutamate synthase-like GNAT family acetyltransferase